MNKRSSIEKINFGEFICQVFSSIREKILGILKAELELALREHRRQAICTGYGMEAVGIYTEEVYIYWIWEVGGSTDTEDKRRRRGGQFVFRWV